MDLQGKPSYQRLNCPVCTERADLDKRHRYLEATTPDGKIKRVPNPEWRPLCHGCKKPIPEYEQGRVKLGFDSVTVDHWHFKQVGGMSGVTVVKARLCFDCLLKDWKELYPEQEYGAAEF